VRGTLEQIEAIAGDVGDVWVRCVVREKPRIGLADEVRALLPDCVDVVVERVDDTASPAGADAQGRIGRTPRELFTEFLDEEGRTDPRLIALFDELHDEVTSAT
jgi:exonuclease SbcD